MTARFDFTAFRINFTQDAYTIDHPVPFPVNKNGKWQFDDPQYPMELSLTPDGGNAVKPEFRYPVCERKAQPGAGLQPGLPAEQIRIHS